MGSIFGSPSKSDQGSQSVSTSVGGGGSTSASSNQAYQGLLSSLSPQVSNGTTASNSLASLLGVGGDPTAQNQAFQNWQNSTGYQFGLNQGSQAITQNAAAQGLLDSGSTAKALDTYGQNYANTQYQNYLNPLLSLVSGGTSAANAIGGTGQISNSNSAYSNQSNSNANSYGSSTGQVGGQNGAPSVAGGVGSALQVLGMGK